MTLSAELAEVQEFQAKLEKQASGEQDPELVLDLLRQLERVPVDLDILRKTKVGKTVGKFKRADAAEVAATAKQLIKKWKAVADGREAPAAATTAAESSSPATEEKAAAAESTAPKARAVPAAPEAPEEWSELPARRRLVRTRFARALAKAAGEGDDVNGNAGEVEEALHELHDVSQAESEYQQKFRILFTNLQSNEGLAREVLHGELRKADLVRMSSVDMLSEEVRRERAQVQQMNREAISLDWEQKNRDKIYKDLGIEGGVGQYPCPKCKSKNTSYYLKQTRSADEPMTVFCSCDDCRNRWRIAG